MIKMCLREMMNAGRFILNVVFVLLPRVLEETLDLGVGAAAMARLGILQVFNSVFDLRDIVT